MTDRVYRCTTCGVIGKLEEGETPDAVRPHGDCRHPEGVCQGTRVVEVGSQEELELNTRLRAKMYADLGVDPAKMRRIAFIPTPKVG